MERYFQRYMSSTSFKRAIFLGILFTFTQNAQANNTTTDLISVSEGRSIASSQLITTEYDGSTSDWPSSSPIKISDSSMPSAAETTGYSTIKTHSTTEGEATTSGYVNVSSTERRDMYSTRRSTIVGRSTSGSTTTTVSPPASPVPGGPQEGDSGVAIAGLCLSVIILLIIAVNALVFFQSKLGLCKSRTGVFNMLQMSPIKKKRVIEDDVEKNPKENAEVNTKSASSTSLDKQTTTDQVADRNGEVHVKVDVEDTSKSSENTKDDEGDIPRKSDESKDVDVADDKEKPEGETEQNETKTEVSVEVAIET